MKDYVDQTANIDVGFVEELQVTGRSVAFRSSLNDGRSGRQYPQRTLRRRNASSRTARI